MKFNCDIPELVAQQKKVAGMGYTSMIGPNHSIWVNDKTNNKYTRVLLSLHTSATEVEEYENFTDVMQDKAVEYADK